MRILSYQEYNKILELPTYKDRDGTIKNRNIIRRGNNKYLNKLNYTLNNIIETNKIDISENFKRHHNEKVNFLYSKLKNTLFDIVCQEKTGLSKELENKVTLNRKATYILIENILQEEIDYHINRLISSNDLRVNHPFPLYSLATA
jgi:hypothetical protein